jgi:hypothetical protein
MKRHILIALVLSVFGCTHDEVDPATNTVHLAGYLGVPDDVVACYWKDSVYTELVHDETPSNVTSLSVDGSSVFIAGYKFYLTHQSEAVVWKNGSETIIENAASNTALIASNNDKLFGAWFDLLSFSWVLNTNGTSQPIIDTASNINPTAIGLLGDDVYLSGSSSYHDGTPDAPTYVHAQCWKNGELIFREPEGSNALSIFVHQNDIYMAGYIYTPGQPVVTACYWKNGERVDLTDGTVNSVAKSVFVTGNHVFVCGMIDNQAAYWKDGESIALTTGSTYSTANSIFVKGTDVHVAGHEQGYPAYWKNDVKQKIQHQNKRGQIKFIVVGSN